MLDIKYIRENAELVKKNCEIRRVKVDVDKLLSIDESRRDLLTKVEALRAEKNKKSKGKPTPEEIQNMKKVGEEVKAIEEKLENIQTEYKSILLQVPNLTHPDAPIGGEEDFRIIYKNKEPEIFAFQPKDHEELLTNLDLIDFERAAKVSGSKFYYFKNGLVKMNQALLHYGQNILEKHGYTLIETPDLAKNFIMNGTGYQPRGPEQQIYSVEDTDTSLIATAEITIAGFHEGEILDFSQGPKKYAALSHCFRKEGGAYGRTSKGLYRVHQFTKLEMFIFCKPEDSESLHQELLSIEKEIVEGLEIPYRIIDIASADLGGPAYRKYDLEAWMTMKGDDLRQGDYGEITSTSNCTDYQARRLNIRYKKADGNSDFVHTLNGTAVVLSRFPIVIAENYQQADGSIKVPKVLQKFMGCEVIK